LTRTVYFRPGAVTFPSTDSFDAASHRAARAFAMSAATLRLHQPCNGTRSLKEKPDVWFQDYATDHSDAA
jgi:hypothetical protein